VTSSVFRVIAVDDFEPWHNFVCSTLKKYSQSCSYLKRSDGVEAVYKAHELQPDLIVLDISRPKMHGIEAARCDP